VVKSARHIQILIDLKTVIVTQIEISMLVWLKE